MKIAIRKTDNFVIGGEVRIGFDLVEDKWMIENLDTEYYNIIEVETPKEDASIPDIIKENCFKRYFYENNAFVCKYICETHIDTKIKEYEAKLNSTDYIVIKMAEAQISNVDVSQYNFQEVSAERQLLRDKINELRNLKVGREFSSMYEGSNTLKFKS